MKDFEFSGLAASLRSYFTKLWAVLEKHGRLPASYAHIYHIYLIYCIIINRLFIL